MPIVKLPTVSAEAESYFLPPEKLLSGNPRQTVRMLYTDPTKQFFVGEWESEVGKWRINYTEEEYCRMLEGVSVISDEQGCAVTVTAGDSFVIPRGFVGSWEVLQPTRKTFVIYESDFIGR
jgi:uncharacterized cupin superfamily protein